MSEKFQFKNDEEMRLYNQVQRQELQKMTEAKQQVEKQYSELRSLNPEAPAPKLDDNMRKSMGGKDAIQRTSQEMEKESHQRAKDRILNDREQTKSRGQRRAESMRMQRQQEKAQERSTQKDRSRERDRDR